MNSLYTESVNVTRTHSTCVWIQSSPSGTEWTTRVYIRGIEGLWYLASTYSRERPTLEVLYFQTYCRGLFSERPFKPGDPYDASAELCVLALVRDFCRDREIDAADLIQQGVPERPRYTEADFLSAKQQANWEGALFPVLWTEELTEALCRTLDDPSWGELARLIRKTSR